MQHLDTERIGAFDHEPPTAEELAHLSACAVCRAERDAFDELARLAMTEGVAPSAFAAARLTDWDTLSVTLRREGLLTSASDHRVPETPLVVRALDGSGERIERSARPASLHYTADTGDGVGPAARGRVGLGASRWLRNAAAVALLAGGAIAGRMSAGASALPFLRSASIEGGDHGGIGAPMLRRASLGDENAFASVEQATEVLGAAQREYERASLWLAANDTTVRASDVYRARLAALDQMMAASRAALREAPQDPVLNHYFLAASTAREATLQQLGGALPVDKTLEGY